MAIVDERERAALVAPQPRSTDTRRPEALLVLLGYTLVAVSGSP